MTRQFLTDSGEPAVMLPGAAAAAPAQAAQPQAAQQGQQSQQPAYRDALAGAFPEWDLLPASPFIRRVK
jgi:hypothetical protein